MFPLLYTSIVYHAVVIHFIYLDILWVELAATLSKCLAPLPRGALERAGEDDFSL
jgi:hypothetical protein